MRSSFSRHRCCWPGCRRVWLDKEINVGNTSAEPGSRRNDKKDLINRILLALHPVSSKLPIMLTDIFVALRSESSFDYCVA